MNVFGAENNIFFYIPVDINTKWKQNASIVAGGTATYGKELNELNYPESICINNRKKSMYIADTANQRITEWKFGASYADVVAYDVERESDVGIYYRPIDIIIDENDDSLIICDLGKERVKRWSPRNSTNIQTIITNIACTGLAVDRNGDVYVSDKWKQKVIRWRQTDMSETIVAGGNQRGGNLNQLHSPSRIAVDQDLSVYVADANNHRVMKWMKGAKDGLVVAGGHGEGNSLTQLSFPLGILIDHLGNIFIADTGNDRIMYWSPNAREGVIIVGGNKRGYEANQLSLPSDLIFDQEGHLYVVDTYNHRVQRFSIDPNMIY
ncbi:unnamed protein product [Adineta steineri]|uniref:NHL repeat containing protein n=2 Tax=Adineta steineri TaxID=433720 RepID=A0A819RX70_9BILA|nr:unnamed protein product [Adineta steineri]